MAETWNYLDITSCPSCDGDLEVNIKREVRCVNCKNMHGLLQRINDLQFVAWQNLKELKIKKTKL